MASLMENKINTFLGKETLDKSEEDIKRAKKDKSIVERVNRTILTEDNKQLLL